ncbi:hypothetical protein AVEN_16558-1 [Araneus ventricosus]|uniref:Uncharacterized protein n=1 Tax=Araneus ventricosus TaxID=182803 RepID=A0A4Y2N182_ARAVE|nr:hypothetical protein AVEN_16558-1 [Araneus ventricosus]
MHPVLYKCLLYSIVADSDLGTNNHSAVPRHTWCARIGNQFVTTRRYRQLGYMENVYQELSLSCLCFPGLPAPQFLQRPLRLMFLLLLSRSRCGVKRLILNKMFNLSSSVF